MLKLFAICALTGIAMGVLAGLLGVGGGIIAVPAMIYLLRLDAHTAMGTSLAVIVPVALAGALQQARMGHVEWKVAAILAAFGMVSSVGGAWLGERLSPATLQRLFAIFVLVIGFKMLLQPAAGKRAPAEGAT